jgi:hypothetical protein
MILATKHCQSILRNAKAKKKGREKREGEKARGRFLEAEERMNI